MSLPWRRRSRIRPATRTRDVGLGAGLEVAELGPELGRACGRGRSGRDTGRRPAAAQRRRGRRVGAPVRPARRSTAVVVGVLRRGRVVGHPADARCGHHGRCAPFSPGWSGARRYDAAARDQEFEHGSRHRRHRPHARSDGPTRARSSTCVPTTSAPTIVQALLDKAPGVDPGRGRGRDLGLRAAGRRGGLQPRPRHRAPRRARRRARRHREPLLLVVAADHPHGRARDQGRRGRRVRRRRRRDREPVPVGHVRRRARHPQRAVRRRRGAHGGAQRRAASTRGRRSSGLPDIYIAMGQTAENVAEYAR